MFLAQNISFEGKAESSVKSLKLALNIQMLSVISGLPSWVS